jgi:lipopolysaccharide/colanic/teichoic acid biosynthesis glycosyltransferase
MRNGARGPSITAASDPRVTRAGAILRKYKLDELPQLWNVARGDMSIVGPRPEVPRYVNYDDPRWRQVLEERPGLTDLATLVYRDEEQILAQASEPEAYYREVLLPDKLQLNLQYQRNRNLLFDLRLILTTVRYSFLPAGFNAAAVRKALLRDLGE